MLVLVYIEPSTFGKEQKLIDEVYQSYFGLVTIPTEWVIYYI